MFIGTQALCYGDSTFGQGTDLSILERVNCQGTETLLINCTLIDYQDHYGYCFHSDDAGVRCGKLMLTVMTSKMQIKCNSSGNCEIKLMPNHNHKSFFVTSH